jgi:hypothetical protein
LDANPVGFGSMMAALKACGHRNVVLTGCSDEEPTQQDLEEKAAYLTKLGLGNLWDELVVFGDPPHAAKAAWIKEHMTPQDVYFDNSVMNNRDCSEYTTTCLVFDSMAD